MLQPKRVKHRKTHRGGREGTAWKGSTLVFGDYGMQSLEGFWMTARQIESARRAISHHVKRGGKIWIRVFPDKPITKKAAETRMGSGKGSPEYWVANVRRGRMLFELSGVRDEVAREALRLASSKLPVRTRIVQRTMEGVAPAAEETP